SSDVKRAATANSTADSPGGRSGRFVGEEGKPGGFPLLFARSANHAFRIVQRRSAGVADGLEQLLAVLLHVLVEKFPRCIELIEEALRLSLHLRIAEQGMR